MNTAHKTALVLTLFASGCAVDFSSGLSLDTFDKTPHAVDVSDGQGNKTVTCELTITGQGGAGGAGTTVRDTGCVFASASGTKATCLAPSSVGDVWSCDVTILENADNGTWTVDYVFARDMNDPPNQLFITGAELVADAANVLGGDAGVVDIAVTSTTPDTTAPTITAFDPVSQDVYPGSPVKCRILTDEDPVEVIGCTFLPDDASASISCISESGSNTCFADVPDSVDVGVTYNEVNHFARDAALNVTVADANQTFTVIAAPTTGSIAVNMAALPGACTGASWSISPGGLTGTASLAPTEVAPGDYTITWLDTALGCTVPTASPELKAVVLDTTTTFDLVSSNYTARSTFASVDTNVGVDGNYGAAPTGGGAWTMTPVPSIVFGAQFTATGTGDVEDVAPALGDFYVGRTYTLDWTPEAGYTTPSPNAVTTSGEYQGNYLDLGAGSCDAYTADYTANNGWSTTQDTANAATEDLTFDFYARPTVANQNALFAVSENTPIADFPDGAILIRFAADGFIDVRTGSVYCSNEPETPCDNDVSYTPGEWYHFVVNASMAQQTYTVQVETCDDGLVTVMTDAGFRSETVPVASLRYHGAWSSQAANLDIDQMTWTPGVCTPTTTCSTACGGGVCECGTPLDDCGDPLASCGTCTVPDVCYPEGTCCTPSTTVCTDPDPDYECGDWPDGCGGTVNCDTGGQTCDERVPGETCSQGQCVEGGVPGAPYVHVVPADVGVSLGVGVVAPVPTVAYTGSSTPAADALIENVIINGIIYIENPNITFRNVRFNCEGNFYCIYMKGDGGEDASGLTVEYSKLSAFDSDVKLIRSESTSAGGPVQNYKNLTVRHSELSGGHDWGYFDGDIDGMLFENNYFHTTAAAGGRHADGFQIGEHPEFGETRGTITFRGNYFDKNTTFEAMNALIFMTGNTSLNNTIVYFENNHVGEWGWSTLWCEDADACFIRHNVWDNAMQTALPAPGLPSHAIWFDDAGANWSASEVRCERYEDGSFIQNTYIRGPDNIVTGCPGYP